MIKRDRVLNDFEYTIKGKTSSFSKEVSEQTTLIIWLRHFGCSFYAEALKVLPEFKDKLKAKDIKLLLVVQGNESTSEYYMKNIDIPYIPDADKKTYTDAEIGRTSWAKIILASPALKKRRKEVSAIGCSISIKGAREEHSDALQLSGMALVDKKMKILWSKESVHTGDLDYSDQLITQLIGIDQQQ